jgi:hypothetical protein
VHLKWTGNCFPHYSWDNKGGKEWRTVFLGLKINFENFVEGTRETKDYL